MRFPWQPREYERTCAACERGSQHLADLGGDHERVHQADHRQASRLDLDAGSAVAVVDLELNAEDMGVAGAYDDGVGPAGVLLFPAEEAVREEGEDQRVTGQDQQRRGRGEARLHRVLDRLHRRAERCVVADVLQDGPA